MYGVLSYSAPEILGGQNCNKASDTYTIMYTVISELSPYHDIAHDERLAIKICEGLRPRFNIKLPKLILHLIKRCIDANPSNRPEIKEITRIFHEWSLELKTYLKSVEKKMELIKIELIEQIEKVNNNLSPDNSSLTNKIHPEAIYSSRPFNFISL
ncbi:hypothetical protein RclHR1_00460013 [Rhizophagus clarus]|nr:hypothetical protein RclHR1_00460013 [Rhizophagus clarus]